MNIIKTSLNISKLIIPDNDILIAGIGMSYGATKIITKNKKHFENIRGIEIVEY